jgi:hypothetical protein
MRSRIVTTAVVGWLATAACAAAKIEADALVGRPFGVGRITLSGLDAPLDQTRLFLVERNGRAHYPAIHEGVFGRVIGQVLGDPTQRPLANVTVWFLFRGQQPLELTLYTPQPIALTVVPRVEPPRRFERELQQWWRQYNAFWRQQHLEDNHPPLLSVYLTAMLSRRLGLEDPLAQRLEARSRTSLSTTTQSLELLLGLEALRLATLRSTMLGRGDFQTAANLPLPAETNFLPPRLSSEVPAVEVEPLAMHVPVEWFYVRFGKFSNYLWLNHFLQEYGGDISNMVTLRSYLAPLTQRVQDQLGLEPSALAEVLGDQVIADVALVGRDTFTREGAALGILFQARSNSLLRNDLMQQRQRAQRRFASRGATGQTLQIAGREVSLVSTPDNRLRSFYVSDGDFHLVTTSQAMVERFLTVDRGRGALGRSAEFRLARRALPLVRNDTVLVYFSSAFFEGLFSPQYQVELERRMKSITDLELVLLARWAAQGEGQPSRTLDDLVAGGYLPPGFGRRPDGSGPVLTDGEPVDSRRGARGTFLPIPDVTIQGITPHEAQRLAALQRQLTEQWQRMDPLLIGIQRTALTDKGLERVVIDGNLAPLDESKYGWVLSILGPPTRQMVTPAPGDVISVQAVVRGGALLPQIPPHHLFLGIQDAPPLAALPTSGLLQTLNLLRSTPGYLGSWPTAGFLDLLPFNLGGSVPDPDGFSQLPFGLWRRQGGGFSVVSFDPALLARVTPHLRVVESEVPAQLRVHVEDLSQSKIRPWIVHLYYQRGLLASAGNARFLMQLSQQLQLPLSKAKAAAEQLLDAELNCPLGGQFELVRDEGGLGTWRSTAWDKREAGKIPEDFEPPLLKWFRGLDAHLTRDGDQITTRIELDMQRQPATSKFEIPFPDFNKLFGGGQKAMKPKEPKKAEELPPPLPPVQKPPRAPKTPPGQDI